MFKCNVYLVRNSPLSSVSSIRKQRDREEFLLTLAKARVPLSFSVMSILYEESSVTREKDTHSLDETVILQVPLKQDPKNHGSTPRAARSNSLSSSSFFLFFDFSSFLFHLSFSLSNLSIPRFSLFLFIRYSYLAFLLSISSILSVLFLSKKLHV